MLVLPVLTAQESPAVAVETGGNDPTAAALTHVVVIPVQGAIDKPVLYVLRRGLKEAIENGADLVVIDMNTPGGRADVMLEIMEALDRFPGETLTYVDDEAGSAGALIAAVTDEIYFAPNGVMGAAEIITSTGADVGDALKRKMTSYINAKVRALSDSDPRRADVLKAMTSADFELKIGDEVLKPEGELLTVTADEAVALHGDPATPLLAAGIAEDIDALLNAKLGAGGYSVVRLETTWSEDLAAWLSTIAPVLMGLGLLGLFIEFKTPGFGVFGLAGGALLVIVFLGHTVAGLSGHEPMLFFGLGVLLVLAEIVFFPGLVLPALIGLVLMFGSLVWSMADIWPDQPIEWSGDVFFTPMTDVGLALLVAVGGMIALWRFLPKGWVLSRLALGGAPFGTALGVPMPANRQAAAAASPLLGRRGVAATDLFPSGKVEIDGRIYEASVSVGNVTAGAEVEVVGRNSFALVVQEVPS